MIGIDHYVEWPRLENAVSDAKGASRMFKQLGFVEVTNPLLDEAATGEAMRRLVTDNLGQLSPDDSLVLFFAGHGYTHTASFDNVSVETGCVIPVDATRPRGQLSASWLRLDNWLSDIARLPPRHILVIVDACHSGVALSAPRWRDNGIPPTDLDALRSRRSRRIITSALDNQRAMDGGPVKGHSLFTGCLIEGLSGRLAEGGRYVATGRELGQYLQLRVRLFSQSTQTPDSGEFELDDRGDIVVPIRSDATTPDESESTSSRTSIRTLWSKLSNAWTTPLRIRDGAKISFTALPRAGHAQPTPKNPMAAGPRSGDTIKGVDPATPPLMLAPDSGALESMPDAPLRSPAPSKGTIASHPKRRAAAPKERSRDPHFLEVAWSPPHRGVVVLAATLLAISCGSVLAQHIISVHDREHIDFERLKKYAPRVPRLPSSTAPAPMGKIALETPPSTDVTPPPAGQIETILADKIALEPPPPTDVTPPRAGQIETILADRTPVKEGDVIMRLVGDKPIAAELVGLGRDQKRMQYLIDAATKRRDAAHAARNKAAEAAAQTEITERQKTLALKQNALAAKTAELDNFLVHAPTSGTFSPAIKPGAKVAVDAVVARIQRDPVPSATFRVASTQAFAANASVELAIGKGEQRVTCIVADVQPDSIKVACPAGPALTDGSDVTLIQPKR